MTHEERIPKMAKLAAVIARNLKRENPDWSVKDSEEVAKEVVAKAFGSEPEVQR